MVLRNPEVEYFFFKTNKATINKAKILGGHDLFQSFLKNISGLVKVSQFSVKVGQFYPQIADFISILGDSFPNDLFAINRLDLFSVFANKIAQVEVVVELGEALSGAEVVVLEDLMNDQGSFIDFSLVLQVLKVDFFVVWLDLHVPLDDMLGSLLGLTTQGPFCVGIPDFTVLGHGQTL